MALQYWIISNTGAIGGGKRLRVELQTIRPTAGEAMTPRVTATKKVMLTMDADVPVYAASGFARETETDSANYWTVAELRALRMHQTAANRKLKIQLHDGAIIDALWLSRWEPAPAFGNTIDGVEGWWSIPIQIVKYL